MGDVGQNRSHILSGHFSPALFNSVWCAGVNRKEILRNRSNQKSLRMSEIQFYWPPWGLLVPQGHCLCPIRYHRHSHTAVHTHSANMLHCVIIIITYLLHTDDHRGSITRHIFSHLFLANEKQRLAPIVWTALPNGQFIFQWFKRSQEREEVLIF